MTIPLSTLSLWLHTVAEQRQHYLVGGVGAVVGGGVVWCCHSHQVLQQAVVRHEGVGTNQQLDSLQETQRGLQEARQRQVGEGGQASKHDTQHVTAPRCGAGASNRSQLSTRSIPPCPYALHL